ncbi:hypothetical protein [Leisingera sp. ANG-M7]|uniref:hypothetical protein n=1 Tax=Leisingera sp. ANG-M7 TaxID=1577902 RepID=UPI00057F6AA2|nr:hypothetical protein [Leisingera sp. ANG-M7]KIC36988.1 hypothetical protein RA26_11845 [Leisingera sp. ANG-M7]
MSLFRRLETLGEKDAPTSLQGLYLPGLRYSLRVVDDDTLEVTRMDNGIIRAIMWGMFWLTAYFVAQSWWEQNLLWGNIQIWLNSEQYFREQYDYWVETGGMKGTSFSEFYSGMMEGHGSRWIGGLIFLSLPTFFFYCAFIWPRYRPLRFNRKHRIAYTWSWGRFFLTKITHDTRDLDMALRGTSIDPFENMRKPELMGFGPLVIRLRHHRRQSWKERWALGVFPPSHEGQNSQIAYAISDFLTSHNRPDWCDALEQQPPYSWFDRFLMGAFNLSLLPAWWPRRTERLIQAFLDRDAAERDALRRKANGMDE